MKKHNWMCSGLVDGDFCKNCGIHLIFKSPVYQVIYDSECVAGKESAGWREKLPYDQTDFHKEIQVIKKINQIIEELERQEEKGKDEKPFDQIKYGAMSLCSAYYSGCSEHMIKALMDGLKEVLGEDCIAFSNKMGGSDGSDQ